MSRTLRNALIAAFLFFIVPLILVADQRLGGGLQRALQRTATDSTDRQKYHGRAFTVLEVIDGDTLDIDIPDGKFPDTRIRLLGVDTPETRHPTIGKMYFGPEATDFTTRAVLGKQVTVLIDTASDERDRYGRLLAYVQLPDGTILNEQLIQNGFGYAYLQFPHSRFDDYQRLMDQAIQTQSGLWKNVKRDQLPKWLQQRRADLLR
jgi:micrococcal nuclease